MRLGWILIFLFPFVVNSQITVLEEGADTPIPGATISMYNGNQLIKHVSTNEKGEFSEDTLATSIEVSAIGYLSRQIQYSQNFDSIILLTPTVYQINAAVISGQLSSRTKTEAVQDIRVISSQEIESVNAISVKDVLILESSITFRQDPVLGSQLTMLGMPSSQVQILIDGVPVIGRVDGNIDLDQIPIANVERIEIIQGPMSVEYGSSAIAGTINIITKTGEYSHAQLIAQYQTIGKSRIGVNVSWSAKKWSQNIKINRNFFEGINDPEVERVHTWKPKEQLQFQAKTSLKFAKSTLDFTPSFSTESLFVDGMIEARTAQRPINDSIIGVFEVPFARDQKFKTDRYQVQADINNQVDSNRYWKHSASLSRFQRIRTSSIKTLSTGESSPLNDISENDTSTFDLAFARITRAQKFNDHIEFNVGTEMKHEIGFGKRILNKRQSITNLSLFSSVEIQIAKWTLRPGIRIIYNTDYDAPLVPSFHAKYHKNNWTARMSVARGFRSPELKDLYFLFVDVNHNIRGNEELLAENSWNFQAKASKKIFSGNVVHEVSIGTFLNQVDNQIILTLTEEQSGLFQYVNLNKAQYVGLNGSWQLVGSKIKTNIDLQQLFNKNPELSSSQYNRIFQVSGSLSYQFLKIGLRFELRNNYFGESNTFNLASDGELINTTMEAYTMTAAYLHKNFLKPALRISVGMENILDQQVLNGSGVSVGVHSSVGSQLIHPGRTLVFNINYTFK